MYVPMSDSTAIGFSEHLRIHGGEIGKLIWSNRWEHTSLGKMKDWPQSLRSSVSICINSTFPIAIWWGEELVKIYNESFYELLQLKHPDSLGTKGVQLCPELWNTLGPLLQGVLKEGKANQVDTHLTFLNGDASEKRYFTFFNSPIFDESGKVGGVFTAVSENTQAVLNLEVRQKIEENEEQLRMAIDSTDLGTWDYNPLSGELNWSQKCREIFAVPEGRTVDFSMFTEHIHPDDKAFVVSDIQRALDPVQGGYYDLTHRIMRFSGGDTRWIRAQCKVYFNVQNQPERFIGTILDVTEEREHEVKQREYELKMQLTMQASAMGSFEWNMPNSEFHYSDRLAEIYGFRDIKNLIQEDFRSRIHPEDRALRLKAHEEALQTGILFYEVRLIWPDGSIHWIRLNGQILFDALGEPDRMYGTVLDITDSKMQADALEQKVKERTKLLKQINEELKLSEERYHKMTEEVQDYAIILLDKEGTIVNWNKGAQKIKGYREEEIIGKNFSIFYREEDRKNKLPENLISRARKYGRAEHEGWRKRKEGSIFWGSVVITALHDDNNNIIGFTKVTRDLTERKQAEDKMRQHATELEIKNKQLEQFAYIASHDLQEPLRKIRTFVQVLERKLTDPEAREKYFTKINSSAKRMGDLIQSILNYSRLSKNDQLWVPTDLNIVLENVKSDYELLMDEKKAKIKSDVLPTVKGISLQLSQLFSNLIGNSLKFSEEEPLITISSAILRAEEVQRRNPLLDGSRNYVELIFKDNGIGFDQQYAEKIFTIFQRLNSKEEYSGTGIGLALCKKIVENHDGHIQARSELGKGAEFIVYLPLM
jgi:PAS domain S-box-containing protein